MGAQVKRNDVDLKTPIPIKIPKPKCATESNIIIFKSFHAKIRNYKREVKAVAQKLVGIGVDTTLK